MTAWGKGGKFRLWRVPVNIGIYAEAQRRFSTIEPSLLLYLYSLVFPQFGVQSFNVSFYRHLKLSLPTGDSESRFKYNN